MKNRPTLTREFLASYKRIGALVSEKDIQDAKPRETTAKEKESFDFYDALHRAVKQKCDHCKLEYQVFTWHKKSKFQHCPECGRQGGQRVLGDKVHEGFICEAGTPGGDPVIIVKERQ